MKYKLLFTAILVLFIFVGCNSDASIVANSPENALAAIAEQENREVHIFDSIEINKNLVLIVFRGALNDKDIWIAHVNNEEGNWSVNGIILMNQPFEGSSDPQTHYENFESGYTLGYTRSHSPQQNTKLIEIDDESEWKIRIELIK